MHLTSHGVVNSPPAHHVVLVGCPLLENCQGEASVQHSRSRKHHHWPRIVHVALVKWLDVLEVKHVAVNEGLSDFLVGPCDEHTVVFVGL